MNIHKAIYTYLQTKTAITSLLGTRIYPSVAPQVPQFPYCVYRRSGETHYDEMTKQTTLTDYWMEFRLFCASDSSREALRLAFKNVLEGRLNENMTDGTTTALFECWFKNAQDNYIHSPTGKEIGSFQLTLDFQFKLNIAAPTLP